ncbi:MAG: ATP-dependent zinc metalloprotease FtsH [Candidatus Ancillula sp.]|nr:ATP-dependent zinc metalloprotease FtsH [Candidatus Ancillula sp.]
MKIKDNNKDSESKDPKKLKHDSTSDKKPNVKPKENSGLKSGPMSVMPNKTSIFKLISWVLLLMIIGYFIAGFFNNDRPSHINTSDGIEILKGDNVKHVEITEFEQRVNLELNSKYEKDYPDDVHVDNDKVFFNYVRDQGASIWEIIREKDPAYAEGFNSTVPQSSIWDSILSIMISMLLILGIFYFAMSRMGGQGQNPFTFAKSKAKNTMLEGKTPDVTFEDVAGADEATEEMGEIRDFMMHPEKYRKIGAKIPKGVLLYGPPGTGKTLLARALAGEVKAPFFSLSGSDFVEMFVGVGASRVRDLFKKAKQVAPSIIFIDEIDAVGRHRGSGIGGGNDEREQTLNQILVEMDGFDGETNVLLIASTNRPDILDPALLRPGRFDRQIAVDAPDQKGREAILKVHSKDMPFADDVDLAMIAKRTPGYTGADLANVVNESALLSAREGKDVITIAEVDESIDRVMAGPQRKSRKMNERDLRNTAYHEGGHALVAAAMHYTDPVTKVTILPRGRALGYTSVMPQEDKYSVTRNELLDQMAYAMGGRVAEEIVFKDPSTGASNDIEKATDIARKMVTQYGMSSKIGPVKVSPNEDDQAMGAAKTSKYSVSATISSTIDSEISNLLENAHREAFIVINENREVLDRLANILLEKETLLEDELTEIFKDVRFWGERPVWNSLEGKAAG